MNSCPMVASSGFRRSPGHATSSDAMSIEEAALPVERGGAKLFFLGGGMGWNETSFLFVCQCFCVFVGLLVNLYMVLAYFARLETSRKTNSEEIYVLYPSMLLECLMIVGTFW